MLDALRKEFDRAEGIVAHHLLASAVDDDGNITVIWSTRRERIYGKSWNIHQLHTAFYAGDPDGLAEDIWTGEIDEPHREGYKDVERARALVSNPEDVR